MGFGSLRCLIRPLSRTLTSRVSAATLFSSPKSSTSLHLQTPWTQRVIHFSFFAEPTRFDRLTDSRFPKRRPVDKPRRKRASIRPPGPYAWVEHVPNEPIKPSNPNKGSVKLRNEKKRRRLRREFILAEAKKRKAQMQEAKRKKMAQRVQRKMAKVAREREWAQRLVELQRLEEEKKRTPEA